MVAVTDHYEVFAWGDNHALQLGLGERDRTPVWSPLLVPSLIGAKITQVSCGAEHTCVITENGKLMTFGAGKFGRLGHASEDDVGVPRVVDGLLGMRCRKVVAGRDFTYAVCEEDIVAMGNDGEIGKQGTRLRAWAWALRKLKKEKNAEIKALEKSISNLKKLEESLKEKLILEKKRGEDAVMSALEDAKATLEAQQAIVRAAEDRNLRSHMQVQKEKKKCRDGLIKADEKVAIMEEEMEELQKNLVTLKRRLRKEKKKNINLDEEEPAEVDKIKLVKVKNDIRKNLGQVKGNLLIMKKEYNKQLQKSKKRGIFKSKNLSDTELGEQSRKILGLEQQHSKLVAKYEDKTLKGGQSSNSSTDVSISFDAFLGSSDHTSVEMTGFGGKRNNNGFSTGTTGSGFGGMGGGGFGGGERGDSNGGGGSFSPEDGFGDEELTEFDKQCMATIKDLQQDIDEDLDLIEEGVAFLKEAAETMGEQLDLQGEMLDEVSNEVTKAQSDLDNLNTKTKDTLRQQASVSALL
eukprot:g3978.t1